MSGYDEGLRAVLLAAFGEVLGGAESQVRMYEPDVCKKPLSAASGAASSVAPIADGDASSAAPIAGGDFPGASAAPIADSGVC